MTIKQLKAWLLRARRIDSEINALCEQKRHAYAVLTSGVMYEDGSNDGRQYDAYAALSERIETRLAELYETRGEILDAIGLLEDPTDRAILIGRYLNGHTWARIAEEVRYSYKQVTRKHGAALLRLREVMERK